MYAVSEILYRRYSCLGKLSGFVVMLTVMELDHHVRFCEALVLSAVHNTAWIN